jgi:hypothetical protein
MQYSNAINAAMLDLIESMVGSNAKLKIYSGSVPADINTAIGAQVLLVDIAIPGAADWMLAATVARPSVKNKQAATWTGTGTVGAGAGTLATFFRLTSSGDVAGVQGTVGQGAGELSLDNATIATNQVVSVPTNFAITSGN